MGDKIIQLSTVLSFIESDAWTFALAKAVSKPCSLVAAAPPPTLSGHVQRREMSGDLCAISAHCSSNLYLSHLYTYDVYVGLNDR